MNTPLSYPIYDAHTHIFPNLLSKKASQSIGDFYKYDMYAPAARDKLLQDGQSIGVKGFVVCACAVTASQVSKINDFIAESCQLHPEFVGLAAMHPAFPSIGAELDRARELGLTGVKLHPDFQKFYIDDEAAFPMYEEICRRGMSILFHVGDHRYDYSSPERLAAVMRKFPDLRVHAAHFGGHRVWERTKCLDRKNPNLWFDTSSSLAWLSKEEALDLLDYFGTERFLFGSDFPMWDTREELQRFFALGLSESENRAILCDNFERIYLKK